MVEAAKKKPAPQTESMPASYSHTVSPLYPNAKSHLWYLTGPDGREILRDVAASREAADEAVAAAIERLKPIGGSA